MTVKELIERLKQFPEDIPIVIEDADTNWLLNIGDVESSNEEDKVIVVISGSYSDEFNG